MCKQVSARYSPSWHLKQLLDTGQYWSEQQEMSHTGTPKSEAVRSALGVPSDADISPTVAFAWYCVQVYKSEGWTRSTLSENSGTDSATFTKDYFASIYDTDRRRLCDLLRDQEVYVPKDRNINTANALFDSAQNKLEWRKNKAPSTAVGPTPNNQDK